MGKISTVDGKEVFVQDGDSLIDACNALSIEIGCQNGFCRTCEVTILEGADNLTARSDNEEFIGLPKDRRLACQCSLKSGDIKIRIE